MKTIKTIASSVLLNAGLYGLATKFDAVSNGAEIKESSKVSGAKACVPSRI